MIVIDNKSNSGEVQAPAVTFDAVSSIIRMLEPLNSEERRHALNTVATWFRLDLKSNGTPAVSERQVSQGGGAHQTGSADERFSGRTELGPKEFIFEKDPHTDVERMACLAYYLTHFRDTPHFKTVDLSRLNTEAAQRRFANPTVTSQNAMRDGFFVPASKGGSRQLSAMGERYVLALPDRDAANEVRKRGAQRRFRKNSNVAAEGSDNGIDDVEES